MARIRVVRKVGYGLVKRKTDALYDIEIHDNGIGYYPMQIRMGYQPYEMTQHSFNDIAKHSQAYKALRMDIRMANHTRDLLAKSNVLVKMENLALRDENKGLRMALWLQGKDISFEPDLVSCR